MFDIQETGRNFQTNGILTPSLNVSHQLRLLETEELERVLAGSQECHFLDKVAVNRGDKVITEYKALASMGKFTQKTPDAPFVYHNKTPPTRDRDSAKAIAQATKSTLLRMENGLETVSRTLNPPQVRETCAKFAKLESKITSPRALKVLRRTNFRGRKYVQHDREDDKFYGKRPRWRIMDMLYAVLHFAMLRKDYARAFKVISRLVRRPDFDVRTMYGVVSELLSWNSARQRRSGRLEAPVKLARWASTEYRLLSINSTLMIHNRAASPNWTKVWLMPSVVAKVIYNSSGARAALEALELEITTPPSNQYALNYGILGALAVEVGNYPLAVTSFRRCLQLGGVVPKVYSDLLSNHGQGNIEFTIDPLAYTFSGEESSQVKHFTQNDDDLLMQDDEALGVQDEVHMQSDDASETMDEPNYALGSADELEYESELDTGLEIESELGQDPENDYGPVQSQDTKLELTSELDPSQA